MRKKITDSEKKEDPFLGKISKIIISIILTLVLIGLILYTYNKNIEKSLNQNLVKTFSKYKDSNNIKVTVKNNSNIDQYFIDTIIAKNSSYKVELINGNTNIVNISGPVVLYNIKNKRYFRASEKTKTLTSDYLKTLFLIEFPKKYCRLKYYDENPTNMNILDENLKIVISDSNSTAIDNTIIMINNDLSSNDSYDFTVYSNIKKIDLPIIKKLADKIKQLKPYEIIHKKFYSKYECSIPKDNNNVMIGLDTFNKSIINAKVFTKLSAKIEKKKDNKSIKH